MENEKRTIKMFVLINELSKKGMGNVKDSSCGKCFNCGERKIWKQLRELFGEEIIEEIENEV